MPRFSDDAIVIRVQEWSETSQIVTLLTAGHGKVRGLAKGSKRLSPSSLQRFSGGFELLTAGHVTAVTRPTTELATLIEWDLRQPWRHLRSSWAALQWACFAADLVNALIADEDEHAGVYVAMGDFIAALADAHTPVPAALLRFQWRLLTECGYRPELHRDVLTGDDLPPRPTYGFDPLKGGLTTDTHPPRWKIRSATVAALRALADDHSPPHPDALPGANRLLCSYARAILDKELPTMKLILTAKPGGAGSRE